MPESPELTDNPEINLATEEFINSIITAWGEPMDGDQVDQLLDEVKVKLNLRMGNT